MLHLTDLDGYPTFDEKQCRSLGKSLADSYQNAEPFPHIVIDDFIDVSFLKGIVGEFPSPNGKDYFDRDQERLKFQHRPQEIHSGLVRSLFAELNSCAFLGFLEEITGIKGLIPDPHFEGGGFHETKRGGHLGVHADFNIHGQLQLERRLNLLIYLNEDWDESYGGQLELWNKTMTECAVRVQPIFGRAVIFNTTLDSFHGHPDPLACPPERSRRSIATYYYTSPEEGVVRLPRRTTNFQPRPGTGDKSDWQIRRYHFVNDWIPPKLQRLAHRILG